MVRPIITSILLVCLDGILCGGTAGLTVDLDKPGAKVSPELYGIFFEEINRAGDGGLYVEGGKSYRLSFYAKCAPGFIGPLTVSVEKQDGTVLAGQPFDGIGDTWKKHEAMLTVSGTDADARLVLSSTQAGILWLDMVSLFPKETYKGRENGLRPDLVKMLEDMHPAFVRFPGGCFIEGWKPCNCTGLPARWKQTIGDIAERPGRWCQWGYYSTEGLGFHEYLLLCEDLQATPLFVVNIGIVHFGVVPMDQLQEWVQDALDAIEYANGPVSTKWGPLRAKAGHPEPFHLKYIELGNENGQQAGGFGGTADQYHERYAVFYSAIKANYPDIIPIANTGSGPTIEVTDWHTYTSPQGLLDCVFDHRDRKKAKIYVGEYAVTADCGKGNLNAALAEAAFLTGLERNSDLMVMSSYAPLFVRKGWQQWNPNAIHFDASRVYGTPSYHAQAMFGANRADQVVASEVTVALEADWPRGGIGVGTWDTQAEFKDIKVTHPGKALLESDFSKGMEGWKSVRGNWQAADGVLHQKGDQMDVRVDAGDASWQDYTLRLKARKTGGKEGFRVFFHVNGAKEMASWIIGGWGNSVYVIDGTGVRKAEKPGKIEVGRWYDIRIELNDLAIRCYLDDVLTQETTRAQPNPLHIVSGLKKTAKGRDLILKVVNMAAVPYNTAIDLQHAAGLTATGEALVLKADRADAEDSFERPLNVAPSITQLTGISPGFRHTFPANSVTILRLGIDR